MALATELGVHAEGGASSGLLGSISTRPSCMIATGASRGFRLCFPKGLAPSLRIAG